MAPLVWLVTGCTSGFGNVFVREILARGDKAIATGRDVSKLAYLREAGAETLKLDVTEDQETLNSIIKDAITIYGHIDVLVNNAGNTIIGTWEDLSYVGCS